MKKLVLLFVFSCLLIISVPATGQEKLLPVDDNSQYFWRSDLGQINISESKVFPHLQISNTGSFEKLGRASIVWTIQVEGGYIPAYAIYDKGQRSEVLFVDKTYDTVKWFGVLDNLAVIGIKGNITDIILVTGSGDQISQSIGGVTTDHEIFIGENQFFIWANNTSLEQAFYYIQDNFNIAGIPTNETVLAASIGGAVIQQSNGNKVFYSGTSSNISISSSFSNNLKVGQALLEPLIFDYDNQFAYFLDGESVSFPTTSEKFSFFGFRSSIIFGDTKLYELDTNREWIEIAEFDTLPLDYAIVDINLYLGPVIKSGLGLVMSGLDNDNDGAPDTVEDYYGSLSTHTDTDGDGMSDWSEILNGLNPAVVDNKLDYDNDRLTNAEEIIRGLDPLNSDSDYGGALDGWEIKWDYNATLRDDDSQDDDSDGVINSIESIWNSNPNSKDTDNDGIPDRWEIENTIDPTVNNANEDPDGDGVTNIQEYKQNTDPLVYNSKKLFEDLRVELLVILILSIPVGLLASRKIITKLKIEN